MKKIIRANLKLIIGFMLGTIVSGIGVYAVTFNFASGDVEHTKSDGSKTNVKAALNDLYVKASQGNASAGDILTGKTALSNGTLIPGAMPYIGPVTYPRNGEVGYYPNEGYAWVHLPKGYYEPAQYDWAPEVRLTKDQVKALADAAGITTSTIQNLYKATAAVTNEYDTTASGGNSGTVQIPIVKNNGKSILQYCNLSMSGFDPDGYTTAAIKIYDGPASDANIIESWSYQWHPNNAGGGGWGTIYNGIYNFVGSGKTYKNDYLTVYVSGTRGSYHGDGYYGATASISGCCYLTWNE